MVHQFMVMKRHGISRLSVSGLSLVLTLLTLLYVPVAHGQAEEVQTGADVDPTAFTAPADVDPQVFTAPARVGAIQQGTNFGGVTFVRLHQPTSPFPQILCPGRPDGWFVLPNSSKQLHELEVLLLALDRGFRVRIDYTPATCVAASVGACAINPC
jgi:hypothetical protein